MFKHWYLIAILLVAGCETKPTPVARSTEPFSRAYMTPTTARVGYHFESFLQYPASDKPSGYGSQPCTAAPSSWSHEGTLPPGVSVGTGDIYFSGTPRQPGTWTVRVHLKDMACTVGPDLNNYGDRTISVTFVVEP